MLLSLAESYSGIATEEKGKCSDVCPSKKYEEKGKCSDVCPSKK